MQASLRTTSTAGPSAGGQISRARMGQRRAASIVAMAARGNEQEVRMGPILTAAMVLVSGALVASPLVAPPPANAETAAEKRAADKAKRKAILAETRAKAEASYTRKDDLATKTAQADEEIERKNAERRRLAAERAAAIDSSSKSEYDKQAARAVQTPPPLPAS